ncbi:MAG: class II aldolase/adducin family protein [Anaerolineaceae bacterium]|nr:class II aldolase/adducin family protein [Anaerolineaceae bacterium]
MRLEQERSDVLKYCRMMIEHNLTTGSGGNISIYNREEGLVAISPGSKDYFAITPEDIMIVDIDGNVVEGRNKPSSETSFHLALLKHRPDVNSVVHSHSVHATTVACLREDIPPLHYLVGLIGDKIPCTPYATFATVELAENIVQNIGNYNAALLANHGVVSVGRDVGQAFTIAEHVELIAHMYLMAKSAGSPVLLDGAEMERLQARFKKYIFAPKE